MHQHQQAFIPITSPVTRLGPSNPNFICKSSRIIIHPYYQRRSQICANLPIPLAPKLSDVWELDFYSRPVVGLDGKKLWELIITDSSGTFEHVEAIPNSMVNSKELRRRISAVIDSTSQKPTTIKFFRTQMINMIRIALNEIDVSISPSRRTHALYRLIREREEGVYTKMPGFKKSLAGKSTFTGLEAKVTDRLPDALRCESFAFGSFPLGSLLEFFDNADKKDFFGDMCYIDDRLTPDAPIPGMFMLSKRSYPLAAWLEGTEIAFVKAVMDEKEVVLECGINTMYKFADITSDIKSDVREFEALKTKSEGVHFVAIKSDVESDEVEGFWLLREF